MTRAIVKHEVTTGKKKKDKNKTILTLVCVCFLLIHPCFVAVLTDSTVTLMLRICQDFFPVEYFWKTDLAFQRLQHLSRRLNEKNKNVLG